MVAGNEAHDADACSAEGISCQGRLSAASPSLFPRVSRARRASFSSSRRSGAASEQAIPRGFRLAFFIGIDLDAQIPSSLGARPDVTFARSNGRGQAAAINAAANAAAAQNHDFIALLEDDDQWEPNFLAWALGCLETCDFVSSNQLEVDAEERAASGSMIFRPLRAGSWRQISGARWGRSTNRCAGTWTMIGLAGSL